MRLHLYVCIHWLKIGLVFKVMKVRKYLFFHLVKPFKSKYGYSQNVYNHIYTILGFNKNLYVSVSRRADNGGVACSWYMDHGPIPHHPHHCGQGRQQETGTDRGALIRCCY